MKWISSVSVGMKAGLSNLGDLVNLSLDQTTYAIPTLLILGIGSAMNVA
jgi:hypothetical protein